ncbi:MAG: hypothetical protein ACKVUS_00905 [Saprospiraceae bacterium]
MRNLIQQGAYLLLGLLLASCNKHLPNTLPVSKTLEFTGSKEGWPPRPKDASNFKEVPYTAIEKQLVSTGLRAQLQEIAVADKRVAEALGNRYLLLDAYKTEMPKGAKEASSLYTLVFYSYANNMAVQAQVAGREVSSINNIRSFQPIETKEEIEMAARLVAAEGSLPVKDGRLVTKGIITEIPQGVKGYGNRVLYLAYMRAENDDLPVHYAVVDLTTNTILETGSF